jgi:hypothetical protein
MAKKRKPPEWNMQGEAVPMAVGPDSNQGFQDDFGAYDVPDYDVNWLKSLGYTGAHPNVGMGPDSADNAQVGNGEFQKWLSDQGLTLGMGLMGRPGAKYDDLLRLQAFDKSGAKIGKEHNWLKDESDPGFGLMMAGMAAFMGNYAMAANAMGGGAAAASGGGSSGLAGSGAAIDSAASAAIAGQSAPGAGLAAASSMPGAGGVLAGGAAAPGWMSQLASGDVAGALSSGGSSVLDWAKENPTDALKLLGTVGGGLLGGMGSGGSGGGGPAYVPKTLGGNFQTSYSPQYQAVQQQTGLLSAPKGQQSSGLWQFMGGSNGGMPQLPQMGQNQTTQPMTNPLWGY